MTITASGGGVGESLSVTTIASGGNGNRKVCL